MNNTINGCAADCSSSSPVVAEAEEAMTAAQQLPPQTTEAAPRTLSPIPEETSEEEKLRKRKNVCTLGLEDNMAASSEAKALRRL